MQYTKEAFCDEQAAPQEPQFVGSLGRSEHTPLQSVAGGSHVPPVHWPLTHALPPGQPWKQVPQLLGSLLTSTQPMQFMSPGGQTHWLFEHVVFGAQRKPQPPQLFGSLVVSMHRPGPHSVCPGEHGETQTPFVQLKSGGHALPHAPQLN
jgi:hypothetical protein